VCGVQVVIQKPVHGRVAVLVEVEGVGEVLGIGAEQVVEDVPAREVFDDQVRIGQFGQQRPYPGRSGGRRGWRWSVVLVGQPEPPAVDVAAVYRLAGAGGRVVDPVADLEGAVGEDDGGCRSVSVPAVSVPAVQGLACGE
jgi:hypothetical protein